MPTLKRVALLVVALGCWPPAPAGPPDRSEVHASSYAITAATGEPAAGPGASQKPQVQDEGPFACSDHSGGTGGAQLTDDHISIGLLTKTYPPELVDAVVRFG